MFPEAIFLFLLLIQTALLNEATNETFVVVSTTERLSPQDTGELNNRVKSLESQVALIQKILDAHNLDLANLKKLPHKLENKLQQTEAPATQSLPRHCKEVQKRGYNQSDVYFIQPRTAPEPFLVHCDMETKGGGWTYVLNRFDGSQTFGLDWDNYKRGFGLLDGEFWLGLDYIHYLTGSEINELLVELVDWDSKKVYALYSSFSIGNEQEGYLLKLLRGYSGNAGDSLSYHLGMKFSTKDRDHDVWSGNCAAYSPAAWWYKDCDKGQLTGRYLGSKVGTGDSSKGIYWDTFHTGSYSLKEARMLVRPAV